MIKIFYPALFKLSRNHNFDLKELFYFMNAISLCLPFIISLRDVDINDLNHYNIFQHNFAKENKTKQNIFAHRSRNNSFLCINIRISKYD